MAENIGDGQWREFGKRLGFSPVELHLLDMHSKANKLKRNTDLIHLWTQHKSCPPTMQLRGMISVLTEMGRHYISMNLDLDS